MTLPTATQNLIDTTPAYQRYRLNNATMVAHDVVFSTEQCNIDDSNPLALKPSIPPTYRLCSHCADNIEAAIALGYNDGQSRLLLQLRARTTEADARASLDAAAPKPAPAAGLVGAESSRDPTRGDGGGQTWDHTTGEHGPTEDITPPAVPGQLLAGTPRPIIPFPLGGYSLAFESPDSSNIVRVTWIDKRSEVAEEADMVESAPGLYTSVTVEQLLVEFKGGTRYLYEGIGFGLWQDLYNADSVGAAFDELVKKAGYEYRQIEVDELREGVNEPPSQEPESVGRVDDAAPATASPDPVDTLVAEHEKRYEASRKRRNPTKGESELTPEQLAERDARDRAAAARVASDPGDED